MKKKTILLAVILIAILGVSVGAYRLLQNNFSLSADSEKKTDDTQSASSDPDIDAEEESSGKKNETGTMGSSGGEKGLEEALDVTIYDEEGNAVQLSSFQGKLTVLNFWASWCGPCASEMPHFQKLYEESGADINFVMLNLTDGDRETKETAQSFISDGGYTFPVYYDTDLDAADTYYTTSIPVTFIITADGMVYDQFIGQISEEQLSAMIKEAAGE